MSKALEMAEFLEARIQLHITSSDHQLVSRADANIAAELRRLDAENAQLRAELELTNEMNAQLREQNTLVDQACADIEHKLISTENVLDELRAELEAIYSAVPVAWMHEDQEEPDLGKWFADSTSPFDWITNTPLIPLPERKS